MSPQAMLLSAGLLGGFIAMGGGYGLFYGLGRLWRDRRLLRLGFLLYALQCVITTAIVTLTPLTAYWKLFVALSCLAYLMIPPATWRYLRILHSSPESVP
jgi:hypothetical protein